MNSDINADDLFEDISSSSQSAKKKLATIRKNYGDNAHSNLDKVIKVISFIVSISILLICVTVSTILFLIDDIFLIISAGILIFGIIISIISLFIIYAIGHLIYQNNKIIEYLEK